jgi:cation diffusion facilitator CzcD-associated flavoprotein CzcO
MQPQIQGYWRELSYKYDVYSHLVVNTRVTGTEWDDTHKLWVITTQNVVTNETDVTEAEILVPALGVLEIPRFPDIPGIEKFKGKKFHSIAWDSEYDLKHKKVAVIGNGASA